MPPVGEHSPLMPKTDLGSIPSIILADAYEEPHAKTPTPSINEEKSSSAADKLRSLQSSAVSRIKDKFQASDKRTESPKGMQDRLINV
jgi:hypothetical protein